MLKTIYFSKLFRAMFLVAVVVLDAFVQIQNKALFKMKVLLFNKNVIGSLVKFNIGRFYFLN